MVNKFALVVALFVVSLTWGCTDSVSVTTETRKPSATELALMEAWERDMREETMTPEGAPYPKAEKPAMEAKPEQAPAEMKPEAQPVPEDLMDEGEPVKEVGVPESDPSSVKLVPETPRAPESPTVLGLSDPEAAPMVAAEHEAVRNLATLGAKRCMACDDMSDMNQCVTCGHHHKKSVGCPSEKLAARCADCYGETGETVVVYDQDAPCDGCGETHQTGPHCPHCAKAEKK